ncbi:hypothetical protein ES707_00165 [subsurface metagenome]
MTARICPKCLETCFSSRERYCGECGTKLIEVVFKCDCGAELRPSFTYRNFPPWGKTLNRSRSHCPECGRDVRALVESQIGALRKIQQ